MGLYGGCARDAIGAVLPQSLERYRWHEPRSHLDWTGRRTARRPARRRHGPALAPARSPPRHRPRTEAAVAGPPRIDVLPFDARATEVEQRRPLPIESPVAGKPIPAPAGMPHAWPAFPSRNLPRRSLRVEDLFGRQSGHDASFKNGPSAKSVGRFRFFHPAGRLVYTRM